MPIQKLLNDFFVEKCARVSPSRPLNEGSPPSEKCGGIKVSTYPIFSFYYLVLFFIHFITKSNLHQDFLIQQGYYRRHHYNIGSQGAAKNHLTDGKSYKTKLRSLEEVQTLVSITTKWVVTLLALVTVNWNSVTVKTLEALPTVSQYFFKIIFIFTQHLIPASDRSCHIRACWKRV